MGGSSLKIGFGTRRRLGTKSDATCALLGLIGKSGICLPAKGHSRRVSEDSAYIYTMDMYKKRCLDNFDDLSSANDQDADLGDVNNPTIRINTRHARLRCGLLLATNPKTLVIHVYGVQRRGILDPD